MKFHRNFILGLLSLLSFSLNAQLIHIQEDFNNASLPSGWTTNAITGTHTWEFGLDGSVDHAGNNNLDGSAMAYFDDSKWGVGSTNDYAVLESPSFNNAGISLTILEFDYNFRQYSTLVQDEFFVEVFDGVVWTRVFSQSTDSCGHYINCFGVFPNARINISAYANANCKVRFGYVDGGDWSWYVGLDNVLVSSIINNDVGVEKIIHPKTSCSLSSADSIQVMVKNFGGSNAFNFPVSYRINNGMIQSEIIDTLNPLDSLVYTFNTPANLSINGIYKIDVFTDYSLDTLSVNDSVSGLVENRIPIILDYLESFDNGLGGWDFSGVNSSWSYGRPNYSFINQAFSDTGAIVTNLVGAYNSAEFSTVTSPCFDFSNLLGDPELSFNLIYQTELSIDKFWIEISYDNGKSWNKILANRWSKNWYNDKISNTWSGQNSGWEKVCTKLIGAAGKNAQLRFVFQTNASLELEGIGIDEIAITSPAHFDLAMDSILNPVSLLACNQDDSTIRIRVFNNGQQAIDTFHLAYQINGGAVMVDSNIVPGVSFLPGTFFDYTFLNKRFQPSNGVFKIKSWLSSIHDTISENDTLTEKYQVVKNVPYFESFENGLSGWEISGSSPSWDVGKPLEKDVNRAFHGLNALVTNLNGYCNQTENSTVTSPCLDFSKLITDPVISFNAFILNSGRVWVELSIDGGMNWSTVNKSPGYPYWYNNSVPYWLGGINSWREMSTILVGAAGNSSVKIRFRFDNRGSNPEEGVAIDKILIAPLQNTDLTIEELRTPQFYRGIPCIYSNYPGNNALSVRVRNKGTSSISSFDIHYLINDSIYQSILNITPTNPIPPSGSYNVSLNQFLFNLSQAGPIHAKFVVSAIGDSISFNDTLYQVFGTHTLDSLFIDFESDQVSSIPINYSRSGLKQFPENSVREWRIGRGPTPSSTSGPIGDHTSGTGKYAYTNSNANFGPSSLHLPCIYVKDSVTTELTFWYFMYGSNINELVVEVQVGLGISRLLTILGQQQTSQIDPWQKATVDLTQFAGQDVSIYFATHQLVNFAGDIAIDDISIHESNINTSLAKENKTELSFSFWPNPSDGIINLSYNKNSSLEREIFILDLNGRTVERFNNIGNHLNINHLEEGIYIIKIQTQYGVHSKKLILTD